MTFSSFDRPPRRHAALVPLALVLAFALPACGDDTGGTGGASGDDASSAAGTGGGSSSDASSGQGTGGGPATSSSTGEAAPCSFSVTEELQCDEGCDVPVQSGGSRYFCTTQCDEDDPASCPEGMVCDSLFCLFPCQTLSDCPPGFGSCFEFAGEGTCRP